MTFRAFSKEHMAHELRGITDKTHSSDSDFFGVKFRRPVSFVFASNIGDSFLVRLFFILFLSFPLVLCSQELERDSSNLPLAIGNNCVPADSATLHTFDCITNLPDDWLRFARCSFRWENAPLIGGIAVSTIVAVAYDDELYQPVKRQYEASSTTGFFMDRGVDIGDGKFQFGLAAGFALYGWLGNDQRALHTASDITETILAAGGVVQLLKHLTGRESPFTATHRTGRWVLFPNQIEYAKHVPHYDAFPSGHVCTALSTLTVICERYPEATWLPYVGYPAIAWLAYSMVGQGIHWVSDYPLSIAIGYTFGRLVTHRNRFDGKNLSLLHPTVFPYLTTDGVSGITAQWSW